MKGERKMKKILSLIIIGLFCFSMFSIFTPQAKAPGLPPVGYWKFDEGSGSIAHDSSGNGNDGTIHGATWTTGKYGGALSFDGINDYVEIPYDSSLDLTTGITIEAWIKVDEATGDYQIIVAKWYPGGNLAGSYVLEFQPDGITPWLVLRTWGRFNTVSSVTVPFGSWAHVAGTYDGSVAKIYINGTLTGSQEVSGTITVGNQLICIGAHSPVEPADRNWFNGVVDETAIYNYARTSEEIWKDYMLGAELPVGGVWVPLNKFELLAPWIGLASLITLTAVSIGYVKHRKKKHF